MVQPHFYAKNDSEGCWLERRSLIDSSENATLVGVTVHWPVSYCLSNYLHGLKQTYLYEKNMLDSPHEFAV